MDAEELRAAVAEGMPRTIDDLSRLIRIPSVAFPGLDPAPVRASAEATAEILETAGFQGIRLIELPDGADHPAVFGQVPGPPEAPTLLLYAHHDVQPEGPPEEWTTPPFDPVIRDGRLFGRGSSDDKCGIAMHASALRAWSGTPPCTLKVIVEGEEEASAAHLPFLIDGHRELLAADVVGVADGGNRRTGVPTLDASMRGVVDCRVTVRVLDVAVHSGTYGGAVPDALSSLSRILATLHDEAGDVAIQGLSTLSWSGTAVTEDELREETPFRPGVRLIGTGPIAERLWTKPAVSVLGIDAPRVREASNQLVPVATAKVSLRIPPGEDPIRARDLLARHLRHDPPWGVEVHVDEGEAGGGIHLGREGPAFAAMLRTMELAYGRPPVVAGSGGSIPLVPVLSGTFPDAEILVYGVSDEKSQYHSVDESVDLSDLERGILAQALLFAELAAG
ncbi:MAG TPA: M20/M25/M40 family metallo-hydrolase [Actinomycetota bacterium]|jgi:acetylornithine deacetylase/succinyl-diaminopimelate desuccinylase-like protein|nr:M20/M25/M40 family metallo-hydrolase [Actinomycetota bacterium]